MEATRRTRMMITTIDIVDVDGLVILVTFFSNLY